MTFTVNSLHVDFSDEELSVQASSESSELYLSDVQIETANCEIELQDETGVVDSELLGSVLITQDSWVGSSSTDSNFDITWSASGQEARHVLLEALQNQQALNLVSFSCQTSMNVNIGGIYETKFETEFFQTLNLDDFTSSESEDVPALQYGYEAWNSTVATLYLDMFVSGPELKEQIQMQFPDLEELVVTVPDLTYSIEDRRHDGDFTIGYDISVVAAEYDLLNGQDKTITFTAQCMKNHELTYLVSPLLTHVAPEQMVVGSKGDSFLADMLSVSEFDLFHFIQSLTFSENENHGRGLLSYNRVGELVQIFPEYDGILIGSELGDDNTSFTLSLEVAFWGNTSVHATWPNNLDEYMSSSSSSSYYSSGSYYKEGSTSSQSYSSSSSSSSSSSVFGFLNDIPEVEVWATPTLDLYVMDAQWIEAEVNLELYFSNESASFYLNASVNDETFDDLQLSFDHNLTADFTSDFASSSEDTVAGHFALDASFPNVCVFLMDCRDFDVTGDFWYVYTEENTTDSNTTNSSSSEGPSYKSSSSYSSSSYSSSSSSSSSGFFETIFSQNITTQLELALAIDGEVNNLLDLALSLIKGMEYYVDSTILLNGTSSDLDLEITLGDVNASEFYDEFYVSGTFERDDSHSYAIDAMLDHINGLSIYLSLYIYIYAYQIPSQIFLRICIYLFSKYNFH